MQQINYVFINADDLGEEQSITYTDEEYAAMARVLNTIGNFSLNPSYSNNSYQIRTLFGNQGLYRYPSYVPQQRMSQSPSVPNCER